MSQFRFTSKDALHWMDWMEKMKRRYQMSLLGKVLFSFHFMQPFHKHTIPNGNSNRMGTLKPHTQQVCTYDRKWKWEFSHCPFFSWRTCMNIYVIWLVLRKNLINTLDKNNLSLQDLHYVWLTQNRKPDTDTTTTR